MSRNMTKEEQAINYMAECRNELIDYWEDYRHENHEVQYYDMAIQAIEKLSKIEDIMHIEMNGKEALQEIERILRG